MNICHSIFKSVTVHFILMLLVGGILSGCGAAPTPPTDAATIAYTPHTALPLPTVIPEIETAVPTPTQTVTSPATETAVPPAPSPPVPTADPLADYTLDALRQRPPAGGVIHIREQTAWHETFTVHTFDYPSDDLTITGQMHLPQGEGPFPVIILLHGFIFRDAYQTGDDTWLAAQNLASSGYLTLAPDLRSWGGSDNGLSLFHTGLVIDALNLIHSLPSLPQADPERLGLWGHSMGGGIATKLLTVNDQVKTAVLYAPNSADDADLIARWGPGCLPHQTDVDFEDNQCNPGEIVPPGTPANLVQAYLETAADPERLSAFAPIYQLDYITAAVQIHSGQGDGQALVETPPEWAQKLADGLQTAGKEVAFFSYEDQGHFFNGVHWEQFMARTVNFFNANLAKQQE